MEARTKSGKILHGAIAAILVKKGAATPVEDIKVRVKKVTLKKKTTPKEGSKKTKK